MSNAGWSLTESDPGVFTELLQRIGIQGLEVNELWSLDDSLLEDLQPVLAFIFLFKWVGATKPDTVGGRYDPDFPGYFAHQVINNACGTLAVLNGVFNIPEHGEGRDDVKLGDELSNLRAFSSEFDPTTKGEVISNSEKIREVHNSFARSDPFHMDDPTYTGKDEDAYHFITFLPLMGNVYELDGLKESPVNHGSHGSKWTDKAREVIEKRIATYDDGELHFSLMAITADRLATLQRKISVAQNADLGGEMADLSAQVEDEKEKRKRWEFENALRRHNSIGLIHQLLLGVAKQENGLSGRIDKAKEAFKARKERSAAAEKKADGGPGVAGTGMEIES